VEVYHCATNKRVIGRVYAIESKRKAETVIAEPVAPPVDLTAVQADGWDPLLDGPRPPPPTSISDTPSPTSTTSTKPSLDWLTSPLYIPPSIYFNLGATLDNAALQLLPSSTSPSPPSSSQPKAHMGYVRIRKFVLPFPRPVVTISSTSTSPSSSLSSLLPFATRVRIARIRQSPPSTSRRVDYGAALQFFFQHAHALSVGQVFSVPLYPHARAARRSWLCEGQ
jgi:hypothetical protein